MIELSIPQAGEESRNAKDLAFSVLISKHPLSTIEIANIINKKYNAGLTYQAIKKAIDSLVEKKVLYKEGKRYSINKEWLINLKGIVDKFLTNYESGKTIYPFKEEMTRDEYAVYTFTSLLDLDNFWDDMLIYLADHLQKDEPNIFLSHTHYGWWLLINLGKEIKLFEHLAKKKIDCYNLFIGDFPLNRWAEKIYQKRYGKFKMLIDKKMDESISLNVIGNTVIQVKYPKEIVQRLDAFYSKYETVQEMSLKELTQISNKVGEIKFNVFKNEEIAESLRDKYLKKF